MATLAELLKKESLDSLLKADYNCIRTSQTSLYWYHGIINRNLAEIRLKKCAEGTFLVRKSPVSPTDFVLSVLHNGKPGHYKIQCMVNEPQPAYGLEDGPSKKGLDLLIDYYKSGSNGLVCALRACVKDQLPPVESLSSGINNLLHRATDEGNTKVALDILRHRKCPDINIRNASGQSVLHIACRRNMIDLVQALIKQGAQKNLPDDEGITALQIAARNGHAELSRVLLQSKVEVLYRHKVTGFVALHEAAAHGHLNVIQVFLAHSVAAWPRDNLLKTPFDWAEKNGHTACADYLNSYNPPAPFTCRSQWLHTNVDRAGAVDLLVNFGSSDGLFLVRPSSRKKNFFVLCLTSKSYPFNYEISENNGIYYINDGPYMMSLEHLIEYYSQNADGLPCKLSNAICTDGYIYPLHDEKDVAAKSEESGWVFVAAGGESEAPMKQPKKKGTERKKVQRRGTLKQSFSKLPVPAEPMKLDPESIHMDYEIGQGEFGSVMRGRWTTEDGSQVNVAIKSLNQASNESSFLHEAKIMVKLDHPYIVKLIGICEGPPLLLVQQLVEMGSMLDYLLDYPERINVHVDLYLWASQVASGMTYVAEQGYIHRDLAARNILLATKLQVKVGDFGLSRCLDTNENYQASTGGKWPIRWYALESVLYGQFSSASDVWGFGVTLWEMFTFGEQPYTAKTGSEVVKMIESGGRLPQPSKCPDGMYALMLKCWQAAPEVRPNFRTIYTAILNDPDNEGRGRHQVADPDFFNFLYQAHSAIGQSHC